MNSRIPSRSAPPARNTPQSSDRVILFTRYPTPGKAKTRLIPALGEAGAAGLQRWMTELTWSKIRAVAASTGCGTEIRFEGGDPESMASWLGEDVCLRPQGDGDLGQRMFLAIQQAFQEGARRIVIVGSDCPGLTEHHIRRALAELDKTSLVIGPAKDGGYYLIGLTRPIPELFDGVTWGSAEVLGETIKRGNSLGILPFFLQALDDVDRPEDLDLLRPGLTGIHD